MMMMIQNVKNLKVKCYFIVKMTNYYERNVVNRTDFCVTINKT